MTDIPVFKLREEDAKAESQSNGWLLKWNFKYNGHWVWVKTPGHNINWAGESYAEIIATAVAKDLGIQGIVEYSPCIIELNGQRILGCISNEFLIHDLEYDVSFGKLMEQGILNSLGEYTDKEGYEKFISDCKNKLGLNMRKQLEDIIVLDSVILNRDRTFRNFGIILNNYGGEVRKAPIYDSGSSLGLDMYFIESDFYEEEKYSFGYRARPFCFEYEKQLELVRDLSRYNLDRLDNLNKTLGMIVDNFSIENNCHGLVNPMPSKTDEYIRQVINAGVDRLR